MDIISDMRKIYGIGETVVDILFKENSVQTAKPGGSVLNAMVSLGRCGAPASFISEYGEDGVGDFIGDFLEKNGVSVDYVTRKSNKLTSLSMAFLDSAGKASYSFYHDPNNKFHNIFFPELSNDEALLFGSSSALWTDVRDDMMKCIGKAKDEGAFILYDPNFRKNHAADLPLYMKMIVENMSVASVVKGSDEDFINIFGTPSPDEAWKVVSQYTDCMIYTAGASDVFVYTPSYKGVYDVPKIVPVSTVGAGDNFNAGVLFSVFKEKIHSKDIPSLKEPDWRRIITTAISFASHVCCSYDNYVSEDFGKEMQII